MLKDTKNQQIVQKKAPNKAKKNRLSIETASFVPVTFW